jgi:hypothetical protein
MTIIEINRMLSLMSVGSKAHFFRYMVELGMFKNEKIASIVFRQYLVRKPNASSFIKRQQISYAFEEWRYRYGYGVRGKSNKLDVIEKYNEKLSKYWRDYELYNNS